MPLSHKISALLAHERKWLTLTSQEDRELEDQRKASQFYKSGLNGSYLLTDSHEEHVVIRGRLASTLSNADKQVDSPIHVPMYKHELGIMEASKDLFIVP